jgi:hypothetical protein
MSSTGIFWFVPDGVASPLLADATPLIGSESYGEFLTHPTSHHDFWSALQRLPAMALVESFQTRAPLDYEYEDWPRGRIVFHRLSTTFIIYRDIQLATPPFIETIVKAFDLSDQTWRAESDAHYSRSRGLPGPPTAEG